MSPSPKMSAAGPSFFSSYSEKYSNIALIFSERVSSFSQAGGTMETTAETMSSSSSTILFFRV